MSFLTIALVALLSSCTHVEGQQTTCISKYQYTAFEMMVPYSAAEENCRKSGQYPAKIVYLSHIDGIKKIMRHKKYYIGAKLDGNVYKWFDGNNVSGNWVSDQFDKKDECVVINSEGLLEDEPCSSRYPYICFQYLYPKIRLDWPYGPYGVVVSEAGKYRLTCSGQSRCNDTNTTHMWLDKEGNNITQSTSSDIYQIQTPLLESVLVVTNANVSKDRNHTCRLVGSSNSRDQMIQVLAAPIIEDVTANCSSTVTITIRGSTVRSPHNAQITFFKERYDVEWRYSTYSIQQRSGHSFTSLQPSTEYQVWITVYRDSYAWTSWETNETHYNTTNTSFVFKMQPMMAYDMAIQAVTCAGPGEVVFPSGDCIGTIQAPAVVEKPLVTQTEIDAKIEIFLPDETRGFISCLFVVVARGEDVKTPLEERHTVGTSNLITKSTILDHYIVIAIPYDSVVSNQTVVKTLGDGSISTCNLFSVEENSTKNLIFIGKNIPVTSELQTRVYVVAVVPFEDVIYVRRSEGFLLVSSSSLMIDARYLAFLAIIPLVLVAAGVIFACWQARKRKAKREDEHTRRDNYQRPRGFNIENPIQDRPEEASQEIVEDPAYVKMNPAYSPEFNSVMYENVPRVEPTRRGATAF